MRSRVGQCRLIPPLGLFNGARCLGEHLFYGTPLVQFQRHLGLESPFLLGQLFGCREFMCRERRRHGGRMTLLSILECNRDLCELLLEIDASRALERDPCVVLSPLGCGLEELLGFRVAQGQRCWLRSSYPGHCAGDGEGQIAHKRLAFGYVAVR